MQIDVFRYLYSDESTIKTTRRTDICLKLIDNLYLVDQMSLNYTQISKELEIERKTLYNYFDSPAELHVCVALCILEIQNKSLGESFRKYKIESNIDGIDLLFKLSSAFQSSTPDDREIGNYLRVFENLFYSLSQESKEYYLYTKGVTYIRRENDFFQSALQYSIDHNEIKIPENQTIDDVVIIIEQSILAMGYRIMIKEHEDSRINANIFYKFLEQILNSYKVKK